MKEAGYALVRLGSSPDEANTVLPRITTKQTFVAKEAFP